MASWSRCGTRRPARSARPSVRVISPPSNCSRRACRCCDSNLPTRPCSTYSCTTWSTAGRRVFRSQRACSTGHGPRAGYKPRQSTTSRLDRRRDQHLHDPLWAEAAGIKHDREQRIVIEVRVVDRFHPRTGHVVVMLDGAFSGGAIDDMVALVGVDAPLQRSVDAYVDRRNVVAQAEKRAGSKDHAGRARSLAQDRAAKLRERAPELELRYRESGTGADHGEAEPDGIQAAADPFFQVCQVGNVSELIPGQARKRLEIEQRHPGRLGEIGGDSL